MINKNLVLNNIKHGYTTVSMPLPVDHWSLKIDEQFDTPPMLMRVGTTSPARELMAKAIFAAGKYAYRVSGLHKSDHDPDAFLQNLVIGLVGYWTETGLSTEDWLNPPHERK